MNITIIYESPITGSTWNIDLDRKDYSLISCYLKTKQGKMIKVVLSPKRDWLLWLYLNNYKLIENNN